MQAHQGRDAKEKVPESSQDYNRNGVLFQPHHPRTIFHRGATQQHTTAAASAALSCKGLVNLVNQFIRELLELSRCELQLWEAGNWGRGQFGNQEEGEYPPLEAATKQRQWRRDCGNLCVCVCV
jgi:hypothetical protein